MGPASGQVPDEPAVHRACQQLPPLCPLPGAGNMVQQPLQLRAGKIGIDQKARFLRHRLLQAVRLELVADGRRPAALPHDGVADRFSCAAVPQNGGLPLVGDAHGSNLLGVDMGAVHRLRQGPGSGGPDLHGIVLHPAGLGIDLAEGMLRPGHDLPCLVEQNCPGTGGSLIQCRNVSLHMSKLLSALPHSRRALHAQHLKKRFPATHAATRLAFFAVLCYHKSRFSMIYDSISQRGAFFHAPT